MATILNMYQFCDGESEKPFPKHFEKSSILSLTPIA